MLPHQIHDKLTRKLLENLPTAMALFKRHLPPQTKEKLDLTTLKACAETAIDKDWKRYHNDIVFSCPTKKKKGNYVYLFLEHQSTPDRFMPARMLRYKMTLLGKYLDAKSKREKLPNVIGLVLYHGEKAYPYEKDIASCFEDKELAKQDMLETMTLIDLASISEDKILDEVDADTLLMLLLKYSRDKDFIRKMRACMHSHPQILLSLSPTQAGFVFEYILHLGKGTPQNAEAMKATMNQMSETPQGEKIFSLMDYFKEEARQEARQEAQQEERNLWTQKIKDAQRQGLLDHQSVRMLLNANK